ncbi:UDP-N-acetylmuramoyl-tripeptide--D-alanyl-D-alanine ligase [Streptococcus sciuri]|uniref:UDP-N-acetylmuramoyl-tripeptide--D-alanyl-D-alanine ligase n=1 Tax=Streptococcus sciuri TaxID=2973939 RepID=A0ABT2F7B3_9STRE|nr:UDP-N-acetylmuramoyl-tripeptide--D-alanyl-D-alanine ligase [Streptococcus sciuri]MCS4488309.1 UDP-N-acetylmuramoyl-tripeptide--D-alanyl-D-alanine ligase [Streptococcus sciuri]
MKLTLSEIAKVVDSVQTLSDAEDVPIVSIEFDSRKVTKGSLFVPLKGTRNGHDFIETAFLNGAVATLSEHPLENVTYILVDDCLQALQKLAAYYLEKMRVDVIAVTGSNGKTSTKDMIASVLETTYKTYKTQGNYNNEIGLPYTILHMPDDTEKIVLEMGQDRMGDIHLLSLLAKPRIAVVTLIGEAHLAFFGSRDQIAKGKLQIVDGMDSNGIVLLPNDPVLDPYLPTEQKVITFGQNAELQVQEVVEYKDSLTFKCNVMERAIKLPVTGKYNATNAMIATYVGKLLAVADEDIKDALEHITLTKNRTEWKKAKNGADILSDVYNANPTAMRLILETFSAVSKEPSGKKIAVLADMKELGEQSRNLHNQMIMSLSPDTIDTLVCYGEDIAGLANLASQIFPIGKVYYFKKTVTEDQMNEMIQLLESILGPTDQILLKGSNSMHLDKVVASLEGK